MPAIDSAAVAAYAVERTRQVIERFGPRPPGSAAERQAQDLIAGELAACCDGPVERETFSLAAKAFFAMQAVGGVLALAAFAAYWVHPAAALACALMSAVVMYNQLLRYRLFLDPFFPKGESVNIAARLSPSGPVRRRFILNAHPDAAYEWRFHYLFPKVFPLIVLYTLVSLPLMLAVSAVATLMIFAAPEWFASLRPIFGAALGLTVPAGVIGLLFNNLRVVAPGANDNLSGCFLALGLLKQFRDAGLRPEHTELMAVVTGAEEAGLRGAKVWAARHKAECEDVETVVIALDTFGDLPHLTIYNRDMNGTVAHDPAVCELLRRAAVALGKDIPFGSIHLGSSDGAAFTQAGFRAAALCAMDPHPAHYYHNRRDAVDAMSPECIAAAAELLAEAIRMYDANGLDEGERE